ncbi:replicative DNA helicase [Micromonospora sp. WMMD558]|uniref:replicative DNA helicase n=1 Tax=Micromonospora sp. WMMD558 TaxID=3403462 RepID=UPI003BF49DB8
MTDTRQDTRTPAYDLAAERVVLGALMTDPKLIDEIAAKLTADDFYRPVHGELFTAIVNAHDAGIPTEPLALAGHLADQGRLDHIGGGPYLHTLVASVPTAAQAGWYVDRVAEMATRRRLEATGIQITHAATNPGYTAEQVAGLAEDLLRQVQPRRDDDNMVPLGALLSDGLEAIEHRKDAPVGLMTGFSDLDRLLGGLRKQQFITVAAPTGAGKSVFLTDIARNLAIRQKATVAMFTLEMSKEELFERIISAEARVPYHTIRTGTLDDRDWQRVSNALGPMSTAPLFICDQSEITVRQIQNKCRILANRHGLDTVIVDYTQLVQPSRRCASEQEQISDVSRALKLMAGNLDVPVIAAAQMNRGPDMRADKHPQLSDLRGSGSIANDSNVVMFVHRPDYYDKESPRAGEADIVVRKNRGGPTDTVTVASQLHLSRFIDMAIL